MVDKEMLEAMQQLIAQSENRTQQMLKQNNEILLGQFNAVLESNVIPQIKAVAEGHSIIIDWLPNAEEQERLKSRVQVLERIVIDLRSEIDSLKKAQ